MDEFQKAVVDALDKMVAANEQSLALAAQTHERIERIAGHWDRSEERAVRHQEIEERHLFLREREHDVKFANEVLARATALATSTMQNQAWMLDIEARKALQKKLAELDEAETKRQERRAQREAETPKASAE